MAADSRRLAIDERVLTVHIHHEANLGDGKVNLLRQVDSMD
jgi:hypothetical protein